MANKIQYPQNSEPILNKNIITYFGQPAKVTCDRKCKKAWGISRRPKRQLSEDEDDVVFLSDSELGEAPANPGTYEGGYGKPESPDMFPNKWCTRECERCEMSETGKASEPLELTDWSKPVYNQPWKHLPLNVPAECE